MMKHLVKCKHGKCEKKVTASNPLGLCNNHRYLVSNKEIKFSETQAQQSRRVTEYLEGLAKNAKRNIEGPSIRHSLND
jgi:hypothetical protein